MRAYWTIKYGDMFDNSQNVWGHIWQFMEFIGTYWAIHIYLAIKRVFGDIFGNSCMWTYLTIHRVYGDILANPYMYGDIFGNQKSV